MQVIYRPRWSMALFSAGIGAVFLIVAAVLLGLLVGNPTGVTVGVAVLVAVAYALLVVRRVRRRSLTVTEDGMVAQRDAYRVTVKWADFVGVETKRLGALYPVDVMTFSEGAVEARGQVPSKIHKIGADRRIQVGVYVADWRTGPIGALLKRHAFFD